MSDKPRSILAFRSEETFAASPPVPVGFADPAPVRLDLLGVGNRRDHVLREKGLGDRAFIFHGVGLRASYVLSPFGPGWLRIIDLDIGPSVTNDVEHVVMSLDALGIDFTRRRLIYRDTTGRWDEIIVRDARFARFRLVGAASAHLAVAMIGKLGPDD